MKSVIKSLRPEVCMRIANGEQSIITAKFAPKEVPFKVYMYQTRHRCGCKIINEVLDGVYNSGKVIGEVICDKTEKNAASKSDWHISDRKIYDEPKELREFRKVCLNGKCVDCIYEECEITRPPQSWQYVEMCEDCKAD